VLLPEEATGADGRSRLGGVTQSQSIVDARKWRSAVVSRRSWSFRIGAMLAAVSLDMVGASQREWGERMAYFRDAEGNIRHVTARR
jgi:hypothetical protein